MKKGFNHFPEAIAALPKAAHNLVEKVVVDIAAGAGATAPVDTGALAASYYSEVEGLEGMAGTNIEYGPYVEYGTIHTRAQPHLVPSADRVFSIIGGHAKTLGKEIERMTR